MIERMYAQNFRAFEEMDIELSKINLFFGPNNSGKSSILSLLNVLSQTLMSSDHTVPLLLNGVKEDLGTYRDVIHNNDTDNNLTIGIQSKPFLRRRALPPFERKERDKIYQTSGYIELEYEYKPLRHEIILSSIRTDFPEINFNMRIEKPKTGIYYYLKYIKYKDEVLHPDKRMSIIEHFLPAYWRIFYEYYEMDKYMRYLVRNFYSNFVSEMKRIEFIGPFRNPPSRTYLISGESPDSVGAQGKRAIDIMVMDYLRRRGKLKKNIVENVSEWFKSCEISEALDIRKLTDRHFEVVLSHYKDQPRQNLADVGYGCSQVLPILVAGYNLDNGGILMVQEPEIHLHPKAQAELGTFFYELSKRGIQTLIETHSEHLMLRLQAYVADKNTELNPEDIRVYYVHIDNKGKRNIKNIKLKEDGFFEEDWPQGFFPETYEEAKKIAKGSLNQRS